MHQPQSHSTEEHELRPFLHCGGKQLFEGKKLVWRANMDFTRAGWVVTSGVGVYRRPTMDIRQIFDNLSVRSTKSLKRLVTPTGIEPVFQP